MILLISNMKKTKIFLKRRTKQKQNYSLLLESIIFLLKFLFVDLVIIKNIRITKNYNSEIQLIIQGSGNQNILNSGFYTEPSEVYINGDKDESCKKVCNLAGEKNLITLRFKDQIMNCSKMFYNLNNIIEIDLSNFDFSMVTNMYSMFKSCTNLEQINFGNINTSLVQNMKSIFYACSNLKYLDISNFDTSRVTTIEYIFYGCGSLIYLNLFKVKIYMKRTKAFEGISSFAKYCINEDSEFLLRENGKKSNCPDICFQENIKLDLDNKECTYSCVKKGYQFEYHNICYQQNPNGKYILFCKNKSCKRQIQKRDNTRTEVTNTMKSKELNMDCYITCKTCNAPGNVTINNCKTCKENYILSNDKNTKTNCFHKCYDVCMKQCDNISLKATKLGCQKKCITDDYSEYTTNCKQIKSKGVKAIRKNPNSLYLDRIKQVQTNSSEMKNITNSTVQDEILKNFKDLLNNEFDSTEIDEGRDLVVTIGKVTYTITTTNNQKTNDNNNISTLDLGECEYKLKAKYNISINDSLYILKIDTVINFVPKTEYEVYYPFSIDNFTQLNLSECKETKIDISIPLNISKEELDKYNMSSDFYNELCSTYTTESGTDKPLRDRQNEFKNSNISVCEENCYFSAYDDIAKKAICSCAVKLELPLVSEIQVDKEQMFSNFMNIKNIANIKMLECSNLLFEKKYLLKNTANIMLVILFTLSIIAVFSFSCCNIVNIKKYINQFSANNKPDDQKDKKITKINNIKIKKKNNNNNQKIFKNLNNKIKGKKKILKLNKNNQQGQNALNSKTINYNYNFKINNKIETGPNSRTILRAKNEQVKLNNNKKIKKNTKSKNQLNLNNNTRNSYLNTKIEDLKSNERKEDQMKENLYNDEEMNSLSYVEAKKLDKRTFIQYYFSLLRTKNILIFSFIQSRDYNSKPIKIYLFFFTFSINYLVSAMFYSDDTMHKIYVDEGAFDFTYQLPQICYSFLISTVSLSLLNFLGLYEQNVISFKKSKNRDLIAQQKLICRIKCKIAFFFIITYIILFFLWFYLGCFCAVYKNTQIHLLLDVSSSFGLSLVTPYFIYLLPGIFRIPSLKNKVNRPLLFKFSRLLTIL